MCDLAKKPGFRRAADASQCPGPHDGARDRRTPTALHGQEATHSRRHGCKETPAAELLIDR